VFGATTALLGRESAMACHKAVETIIVDHYEDQLRQLVSSSNTSKEVHKNIYDGVAIPSKEVSKLDDTGDNLRQQRDLSTTQESLLQTVGKPDVVNIQDNNNNNNNNELQERILELRKSVRSFRDDEMRHHELSVENGADRSPLYGLVYETVKLTCKTAIWLSKTI